MSQNSDEFVGEMREFKRIVLEDLKSIKDDMKALNNFRWRLIGGSAVICFLMTVICQAIIEVWRK